MVPECLIVHIFTVLLGTVKSLEIVLSFGPGLHFHTILSQWPEESYLAFMLQITP